MLAPFELELNAHPPEYYVGPLKAGLITPEDVFDLAHDFEVEAVRNADPWLYEHAQALLGVACDPNNAPRNVSS